MRLVVRLKRLSNDRHEFAAVRADGSSLRLELETRSFLLHDLTHFALESEAGLPEGFLGKLARGESYEASAQDFAGETGRIEKVVAMLQGAAGDELDAAAFVEQARGAFLALDERPPDWLSVGVIEGAAARLRALRGRWRATPFGESMEFEFSVCS